MVQFRTAEHRFIDDHGIERKWVSHFTLVKNGMEPAFELLRGLYIRIMLSASSSAQLTLLHIHCKLRCMSGRSRVYSPIHIPSLCICPDFYIRAHEAHL